MTYLVVVPHFFIKTLMDEKCDLEYGLLSVFRFYAFSSGLRMSENGKTVGGGVDANVYIGCTTSAMLSLCNLSRHFYTNFYLVYVVWDEH